MQKGSASSLIMVLQFQPTLNLMRGVWLKGVTGYTNLSLSLFIVNGFMGPR